MQTVCLLQETKEISCCSGYLLYGFYNVFFYVWLDKLAIMSLLVENVND